MTGGFNFVLGYHGCNKGLAQEVLLGDKGLEPSANDYDWLGEGIYFWENDPQRAMDWAEDRNCFPPAVVGAVIDLGFCLDLSQMEHLPLVKVSYESLYSSFKAADRLGEMPKNAGSSSDDDDSVIRRLDCAVINNLHSLREKNGDQPFDTVRAPFIEGFELYPGAKIMDRTHIQICVREEKRILGYFHPRFFA